MYFLIDGYNLLFSCSVDQHTLQIQRGTLLKWMQKQFDFLNISGVVVFDGGHPTDEYDISYRSPLEIVYTPKGISADQYIVEHLSCLKNSKLATIVTNDKGLLSHCRSYTAKSLGCEPFVQWLMKKSKKIKVSQRKVLQESPSEVDRLTKLFEERLNEP